LGDLLTVSSSKKQITVGLPVYNGESFIADAINSILNQTFTNFKLIISDNASTDKTSDICKSFQMQDERIDYIRQNENIGMYGNLAFTLDQADTKYFMWLAADDLRHPNFLKMAFDILESDSEIGLVHSWAIFHDKINDTKRNLRTGFSSSQNKMLKFISRLNDPMPNLMYGLTRTKILKKIVIEKYDYWDLYFGHWFEANSQICIIPMYLYTIGSNGIRIPYSVTGKFISTKKYIKYTNKIFLENLNIIPRCILVLLNLFYIKKITRIHNKRIKIKRSQQYKLDEL
jgi:glycosyltransferase involved in cell wall biosynthesis